VRQVPSPRTKFELYFVSHTGITIGKPTGVLYTLIRPMYQTFLTTQLCSPTALLLVWTDSNTH
jgi:hypothetical protein